MIPEHVIEQCATQLEATGGHLRVAVVPCDLDPLTLVRAGAGLVGWAGYFGTPEGTEIGGLGSAWRADAPSGPDRLRALAGSVAAAELPAPARVLVGFAFSDDGPTAEWSGFAPATAVLPAVTVIRDPSGGGRLMVAAPAGRRTADVVQLLRALRRPAPPVIPDTAAHSLEGRPPPADWRTAVSEAVEAIRHGGLSKVVLARSVIVRSAGPPHAFDLVARLRDDYPRCFAFGWLEGESAFVGATPELLAERRGSTVRSHPLAGSAARGEGEADDRALGEALLVSAKDRAEHTLVVDDVVARLGPLTSALHVEDEPVLLKMASVQHLSSEIEGELADDVSVLDIASELHPTPAVGGSPRAEATALIDKLEPIERGWYAGGIGWTDGSGDGALAIALRCALLDGESAHLYAGAGIVAESDPDAELAETRLKFRPLLDLLAAT